MTLARIAATLSRGVFLAILTALLLPPVAGFCKSKRDAASKAAAQSPEVMQVIQRIVTGEKQYTENLKKYSPRVETYLQFDRPDTVLGDKATRDAYFLGRLKFSDKPEEISFTTEQDTNPLRGVFKTLGGPFRAPHLFLETFALSAMVDARNFDQQHYVFDPAGWEYLGDLRCLAIDIHPRNKPVTGAFEGRIWVEDRNYAIVRLNGTRVNPPRGKFYAHFDCWRENLRPNEWLPVYIYSEESDQAAGLLRYKANTRFWGYDLSTPHQETEWTKILVDAPAPVRDTSEEGADLSPVESRRRQEMEAEHNVLQRLEKARLIAPAGPVDKILETVLNNLVVSNHLDNLPTLHCRVMLTYPLESFPLRYTIVLSRGLIDVLPDESSLAMVLAHELGHVVLGHTVSTKYSFNDRLLIPDEELLTTLDLARSPQEEAAADAKALELLKNSPYKDKLGNAGLFLKAAADAAPSMPHLFGPHLGNRLVAGRGAVRMAALMRDAPELKETKVDQIAALPLGARVQVDAWDGSVTFPNRKSVALVDAGEKMPFRVSPLYPHLARYEDTTGAKVAIRQAQ